MAEELVVKNESPGDRILRNTRVNPGETKTLTNEEDIEAAETLIENGSLTVVEGDADVEPDEDDEPSNEEVKKGIDSESIVEDLPHLNDEQRQDLVDEYDNLYELQQGVSVEDLAELEGIGDAYAEDIYEAIMEE